MKYIKKFNTDNKRDEYIKNNWIAPHLFLETTNKTLKHFDKYERLEYISSTTTGGQYINLGCKLLENTDDIHIDIKFKINGRGSDNNNQAVLFGNQGSNDPWPGFNIRVQSDYIEIFAKWSFTNNGGVSNNRYYHDLIKKDTERIDNYNIHNISWTLDKIPNNQLNSTLNTCLFCNGIDNNSAANFINADLYFCKIKKGDLYIDLIPVRKISTNEVGMYDMENDKFYTSQGTEPFVGHELPNNIYENKYRKLEYIKSTRYGGEFIDLGTKLMQTNEDIQIDIKFEFIRPGLNNESQATLLKGCLEDNSTWPGFNLRKKNTNDTLEFSAKHNFTGSYNDNNKYYYLFNNTANPSYGNNIIFEESILVDNIPNEQLHSSTTVLFASYYDLQNKYFRYAEAKMYYLKLYKGGILIHDLIPVIKIKDNIAGLYDRTNRKFWKSQGSYEFQPGPTINN